MTSACRFCRHYTPEGRRGGQCEQLGVPVRGSWQACSLAHPTFASLGKNLDNLLMVQQEILMLREVLPLESSLDNSRSEASAPSKTPTARPIAV